MPHKSNDENGNTDLKDREQRVGFLFVVSFILINLPAIIIAEEIDNSTFASFISFIAFSFHAMVLFPIIIIKYKLPKDKLYWFGHFSLFGLVSLFMFLFKVLPTIIAEK